MLACLAIISSVAEAQNRPRSGECAALAAAREAVERGWSAYRKNEIATAGREFSRALALCPDEAGALTGAAYAAMREGRLEAARALFARAVTADSASYDAVAGAGMAAYQAGDHAAARGSFERALRLAPGDSTALSYLERIPRPVSAASLPGRARPKTTSIISRAGRRVLEVKGARGRWNPLWIKAVNLGAALPGKHPSEFPPDDGTYEQWISLLADMGANAVRLYTVHPPHFYSALRKWNLAHPGRPIWVIHGVWTELPPGEQEEKYDDTAWLGQFRAEMRKVVSLLHGDAAIQPSPGHASGLYVADVSPWTLGYIIGREWEPYSVVAYNELRPDRTSYSGRYISLVRGNPLEAWLAEQSEYLVAFEMERYNAQRPVAYTNWPTLDPLSHPTESTKDEERSLLLARGEQIVEAPREYDNDAVGLDAVKMRATPAFPAGVFASYHAYPYYPEFLIADPGYSRARSPEGPSNFYGYLQELVEHHGDMPVVISEYGVPSSRGVAHFQPQGWHHGGLTEQQQALANSRLTRDIYAAGAAGAGLFALIDEWFKKNWIVIEFEHPIERKRLWLNVLDAEEHYGVVAMRAGKKESAIRIDGSGTDWAGRTTFYRATGSGPDVPAPLQLKSFWVAQDEAYLYLRLDVGSIDWTRAHYHIGIDTHRPELGDTRMPHTQSLVPTGLEFVVHLAGPDSSQVLVDQPYNLYRPVAIPGSRPPAVQHVFNVPFRSVTNSDGKWDSLTVITNRRRIGRDGTIYPAIGYNRNRLLFARQSENSLADWFADAKTGLIEMRLPWGMLHVLDPSSRTVLHGDPATKQVDGVVTDGFRFVIESFAPSQLRAAADVLPRASGGSGFGVLPTWTWPTWEVPQWHAEIKPLFGEMQRTFNGIPDHPQPRPAKPRTRRD
ncbi:MAG TPA: tetratricopeptide repeat protein [Gemmatimonadaceae bacterium]|nr:tetratricopeptide repeat protein [Gemmatimonadaceae bacterium]